MTRTAALPFTLRRGHDVVGMTEITSTRETVHGLLYLDADRLVVQWRMARATDRVGNEIRTDHELGPVREVIVPLAGVASAEVRRFWLRWPPGPYIVLTAADLRAFEEIAGEGGLRMAHPAELVLHVRRADRLAAREFAGELELAVAERALQSASEPEAAATLATGNASELAATPGAGDVPERESLLGAGSGRTAPVELPRREQAAARATDSSRGEGVR
jgi:hypothetical protein